MIQPESHRSMIETLLAKHGLGKDVLEFPVDLCERAAELGHREDNPFRMAKSIGLKNGRKYILIAQTIGVDQIQSVKDSMRRNGFKAEVENLRSDLDFLKHLVLHEVATFVLNTAAQEIRDRWAFEQLSDSG
ncbi:MAG: hypothetical protein ACREAA_19605 [Candidatus Polarisedimenticolia bacterium]